VTENHAQPSPANPDDVVNPLLLQAFAWDLPADSTHWRLLADNAALLADCGVSSVWLAGGRPRGGGGGGGGGGGFFVPTKPYLCTIDSTNFSL